MADSEDTDQTLLSVDSWDIPVILGVIRRARMFVAVVSILVGGLSDTLGRLTTELPRIADGLVDSTSDVPVS